MRRAGRPVIPARRPARAAAALCAAVAVATALSCTGLNGAALTGTAQASTAPTPAGTGQHRAYPGRTGQYRADRPGRPAAGSGRRAPSGRAGVIVNYPAHGGRRLPHVPASAYVIADAGTGQVLAAKDPHGWYRPASTLKVLTAIALMPTLNPDATVVASRRAANADTEQGRADPRRQLQDVRPVQGAPDDLRQRRGGRAGPGDRVLRQGHGADQRRGAPPAGLRHGRHEAERPGRPGPARVRLRRGAVRPPGAGHSRVHARRERCGSSVSRSGRTGRPITPAG